MAFATALRNWGISLARTVIAPFIVGWLGVLAIQAGVELDTDAVPTVLTGIGFSYWAAVRVIEQRFPRAGFLLIVPRPPQYTHVDLVGFLESAKRTFIPLAVGLGITYLRKANVEIDSAEEVAVLTTGITAAYYGLVRAVEGFFPKAGILLGGQGAPSYVRDGGEFDGGDDD